MKQLVAGKGKKNKKFDFYEMAKEQTLDSKFTEDQWLDDLIEKKKWNEKAK